MRRRLWGRLHVWEQWIVPAVFVLTFALVVGLSYIAYSRVREAAKERAVPSPWERGPVPVGEKEVLQSPLAGTWYPADEDELAAEIGEYLDSVEGDSLENVHALILPHAGYRWSGQTAAYGVKQLGGRTFDRVIVMGPSHRVAMSNMASVPDVTHYATPLGEIPLDVDFLAALKESPLFQTAPQTHYGEHSVQIELPLLQQVVQGFRLVPIVVGRLDSDTAHAMATILLDLIDENTLVVASSDFTHYGAGFGYVPFTDDIAENLRKLDLGAFEVIRKKSVEDFYAYLEDTGATICGRCPISVLLAMLPPESEAHLLKYDTSGRMTKDYSRSVSYLSIAFTGRWPMGQHAGAPSSNGPLTEDEKEQLLRLARGTLDYFIQSGRLPTPEELGVEITPGMRATRGAFVTLEKDGHLRGCIGEIVPQRPLYKAVMAQALNAGLADRRFPQVTASELPDLCFEISVLTPPHPVASYDEIVVGVHGVTLEKQGRRAVFLPQVATEQGWGLDQMLSRLSEKAGLPADAWKGGASFSVFEATVFGEDKG